MVGGAITGGAGGVTGFGGGALTTGADGATGTGGTAGFSTTGCATTGLDATGAGGTIAAGGAGGFGTCGTGGATVGLAATGGTGGRTGAGGAAAASFFCVMARNTSPGREMCDKSILVLISSSPRSGRADFAEDPCESAWPRI